MTLNLSPELVHTKEKKETTKKKEDALVDSFEKFYTAYPKHRARKKAFDAWQKLNPHDGLSETILTAIEKQKAAGESLKERGAFVPEWPYAATWLNGRRWEDDLEEPGGDVDGWL